VFEKKLELKEVCMVDWPSTILLQDEAYNQPHPHCTLSSSPQVQRRHSNTPDKLPDINASTMPNM